MRKVFLLLAVIVALSFYAKWSLPAFAAYRLSTSTVYNWDGTDANRLVPRNI
jgi:hypothetical protein